MDYSPLLISIKTSLAATAAAFVSGIAAAWFVMRIRRFRNLVDGIFTIPLVLPPTVTGFFLLVLFGKNGPAGNLLMKHDLTVVFTWPAPVIASSVVAVPLMYKAAKASFEQLDQNLIYSARTLGMSEKDIFFKVILPNCRYGILSGTILAFARAMGEFGATVIIAGNIPGKTQTINFYNVNEAIYLVDLPGYGYAKASEEIKAKWGKMIEDYLHKSKEIRCVFLLVDIRHEPGNNDKIMYKWILDHGYEPVIIATKLDKIKRSQVQKQIKLVRQGLQVVPGTKIIPFSAQTKQGREEIWELIDELTGMAEQEKTPEA